MKSCICTLSNQEKLKSLLKVNMNGIRNDYWNIKKSLKSDTNVFSLKHVVAKRNYQESPMRLW